MATKQQELKPNKNTGRYERRIGWDWHGVKEKYIQPKFYLGKDRSKAELANRRLEQLWDFVQDEQEVWEKQFGPRPAPCDRPLWDSVTLKIAKAVAKGEVTFIVERHQGEQPIDYSRRFGRLAKEYPVITYVPEDAVAYQQGQEIVNGWFQQEVEKVNNTLFHPQFGHVPPPVIGGVLLEASQQSLHQALDVYGEWIGKNHPGETTDDGETLPSQWGVFQRKVIARLKRHHANCPIGSLDFNAVEELLMYWRNRPKVKGKDKQITAKTAKHTLWQLRDFFRWLHRNPDFAWRKPEDFDEIKVSVRRLPGEVNAKGSPEQVKTYGLEELCLLYRYATPIERLLLLLGLNCGFGTAEVGTLRLNEIALRTQHPFEHLLLDYKPPEDLSFIRRVRGKTGVFGDWKLWSATTTGVEWAMARREQIDNTDLPFLLLTEKGKSYFGQTKAGNRIQRIPNIWASLVKRVGDDHEGFRKLSFGKLRKTGANLIRQFSDGEVSGIFLTHGQPVKSDDLADEYTNRPISRVYEAIDAVEKYLQPMFNSCVPEWPTERKKGGPNLTPGQIEAILSLHKQGLSAKAISKQVGVSVATVYRRIPSEEN